MYLVHILEILFSPFQAFYLFYRKSDRKFSCFCFRIMDKKHLFRILNILIINKL